MIDCVSVLPAPSNPFAEAGDTSVVLSWESVTDAASYVVYWEATDGSEGNLSVTATSLMHDGLINGVEYSYWVTAMDTMGVEGIASITVSAIPNVIVTDCPPSLPSNRYTDNCNGTVTDNRSGLIWLKNANCFGEQDWGTAMQSAANLANGQCGLSDGSTSGVWRLPTTGQWKAMVDKSYSTPALSNAEGTGQWTEGDPFSGVQLFNYWSYATFVNRWYRPTLGTWPSTTAT